MPQLLQLSCCLPTGKETQPSCQHGQTGKTRWLHTYLAASLHCCLQHPGGDNPCDTPLGSSVLYILTSQSAGVHPLPPIPQDRCGML